MTHYTTKNTPFSLSALSHHITTLEGLTTSATSSALKQLQRGLTGDRELSGKGYMQDKKLFAAYSSYYFPISYMQASYAISSIKITEDKAFSLLDFGCGSAAASLAFLDNIRAVNKDALINLYLVDYSSNALNTSKTFISREYKNVTVHTLCIDLLTKSAKDKLTDFLNAPLDFVISSHLINELFQDLEQAEAIKQRLELIKTVSKCLKDDAKLILIEPALLKTSRELIMLRNALIKDLDFSVLAPCPHNLSCPALSAGNSQTCHSEEEFLDVGKVLDLAKKAGLDRESVKMTYFVFARTAKDRAEDKSIEENREQTLQGVVVSDAMLNKAGRVRFIICTPKAERISVSAKQGDKRASEIGFFSLKRMKSVTFTNLELRGTDTASSYGIKSDTTLTIE